MRLMGSQAVPHTHRSFDSEVSTEQGLQLLEEFPHVEVFIVYSLCLHNGRDAEADLNVLRYYSFKCSQAPLAGRGQLVVVG